MWCVCTSHGDTASVRWRLYRTVHYLLAKGQYIKYYFVLLSVLKQDYQPCMEPFILRYTWFALNYIFKNLGFHLLQKEGECGLKPTSTCRFWLRLICTYAVVDLLFASTYCYIVIVETTPGDYLAALKGKIFNSKTNTYVFLLNNISLEFSN